MENPFQGFEAFGGTFWECIFFQKGLLAHRSLVGDTSLIFHFFVDGF